MPRPRTAPRREAAEVSRPDQLLQHKASAQADPVKKKPDIDGQQLAARHRERQAQRLDKKHHRARMADLNPLADKTPDQSGTKLRRSDDRQRGCGHHRAKANIGDVGKHMEIETGDANVGHAVHETDNPKRARADDFAARPDDFGPTPGLSYGAE